MWSIPLALVLAAANPLPTLDVSIDVEVHGPLARAEIVQRFRNTSSRPIEAHYTFPLPERAAVRELEMRIGDRIIRSVVQEREQAQRTFENARNTGRKAALVAQDRPNLFSVAVTHIGAGEAIEVRLVYLEELRYEDGGFTLRVPLTHTPRFTPRGSEPAAAPAANPSPGDPLDGEGPWIELGIRIDELPPIANLASPTHAVSATSAEGRRHVVPRNGPLAADRDFVLRWELARTEAAAATLVVEDGPGGRHGMLLVVPPSSTAAERIALPTETLFVVDVSGSMAGPSILQARAALMASLDRLRPEDRFGILAFSNVTRRFGNGFHPADPASIAEGRRFVSDLRAGGGTEILGALEEALAIVAAVPESRAPRIVFLTDGAVSNEDQVFRTIVERLGDARLHAIGIGAAPNTWLMRKMTRFGRGLCEFVSTENEARNRIGRFLERLDLPVLSGVELLTEGLTFEDFEPPTLPDLHAGEPLVVYGRLAREDGASRATVGGWTRDGWRSSPVHIARSSGRGGAIGARWARARIESWMERLHDGEDAELVRERIVELGLEFGLASRYTSLVAVDATPTALDHPQPARFSGTLPQGGTLRPLGRLVGALLAAAGLALMAWGRR